MRKGVANRPPLFTDNLSELRAVGVGMEGDVQSFVDQIL